MNKIVKKIQNYKNENEKRKKIGKEKDKDKKSMKHN